MKIQSNGVDRAAQAYARQNQRVAPKSAPAAQPPGQPDKVEVSASARLIQQVQEQLAHLPEVREQKVTEIRAALAGGTYRVTGEQVAARMMRGK